MSHEDNFKCPNRNNKHKGRPRFSNTYYGKCDVRLDKQELQMLDHLSSVNEVTRSDVMRRALRDYYMFNTEDNKEERE